MEHVLEQERVLIVGIHCGQLPMDRLLVGDALLVNARAQHAVRAMIDRYLPTVTFRGNQFRRLGSVISDPLNCANLLDADEAIISRLLAQHQVIAADLRRKLETEAVVASRCVASRRSRWRTTSPDSRTSSARTASTLCCTWAHLRQRIRPQPVLQRQCAVYQVAAGTVLHDWAACRAPARF